MKVFRAIQLGLGRTGIRESVYDELGENSLLVREHPPSNRLQFARRHPIACDNEGLSPVDRPHYLAIFIPKLTLRDFSNHAT
jgi:hypothetical protein